MAKRTQITQVLTLDDEGLAAVAGLSRGDVKFYVGLRSGGELFSVSARADRQWSRLFVEVSASGELRCECGRRSRCSHRGAVRLWLAHRDRQVAARQMAA